jgi:serine/threonine protein kinase
MSKNIIHRDLKPANIMRFGSQWKIGDFGFARYCKEDYVLEKLYVGTPFYMPP